MALNFRKRIRLNKYINLNLGKKGAGVSVGIPGARFSINSKGRTQASLGLPGTGLYYTKSLGTISKKNIAKTKAQNATNNLEQLEAIHSYQNALFALSHIHTEAYDFFDFETDPIQYVTREIGPKQKEAIKKLESYKPSLIDRLFNKNETKIKQLQENVFKSIEIDDENRTILTIKEPLATSLKKLNPQAMDEFIDMVGGFDVFKDDAVSITHHYIMNVDEAESIIINVTTNMDEDIIDFIAEINNKRRYSNKKLSKTAFNERCYAYICSLALGVATEALAITPLYKCQINISNQSFDTTTGLSNTTVILAGEFDEKQLIQYDYETLNPIEIVERSSVETKFTPRNGFKAVEPIGQNV